MFKVICIKEVSFNVSPHPSRVKAGEEYQVVGIFTDSLFGDYYFLAEDLPTQAYSAENFVRIDGPDEVQILEQRQKEMAECMDHVWNGIVRELDKTEWA